jgi:hypothetical protein
MPDKAARTELAHANSDATNAAARPANSGTPRSGGNEGEGSQAGARQYDDATRAFVASGKVKQAADEAARDIAGPDADALKRAEAEGKKHSHGEDPLLRR